MTLGKKAKQTRTSKRSEFLNRNKEKFDWDIEEAEAEVLLAPSDTDDLPAELPGIPLEEDYHGNDVIEPSGPSELDVVAAARANANLDSTLPSAELTGVDFDENLDPSDAIVVSDDEDDGADNDDEVEIMSTDENANEINAPVDLEDEEAPEEADTIPDPEVQDEDDDEDALSDGAVAGLRRSRRRRRLRQPTVIDFDNRLSNVNEGVLHINPAVLEQTKESFKILDNNRPMEEQTSPRVAVRAPRSAGIDPKALELLFGPKKLPSAGETSDGYIILWRNFRKKDKMGRIYHA
jgi:hypothetical protein